MAHQGRAAFDLHHGVECRPSSWCIAVADKPTERRAVRILVVGAGVIGSVYAGKLQQAGHEAALLARGSRLADLQRHGLVLEDAQSGHRDVPAVRALSCIPAGDRYDLVIVPVRSEQLSSTLPILTAMTDRSDVLFFGNTIGREAELTGALGDRALFGFPAAGGVRDGPVVRYVLIKQQTTMLGEQRRTITPRAKRLQAVFHDAGFDTRISTNINNWLLGHTAFVVPIAFALYRVGTDAGKLATDPDTMRLMVQATREAFTALRASGNTEIPTNLQTLYRLPTAFVVAYWRRVLASPRGELWFAAHSRAAVEEMRVLADELTAALRTIGRPTPALDLLLNTRA
jgi:2-dehydropantoate 2-reductase